MRLDHVNISEHMRRNPTFALYSNTGHKDRAHEVPFQAVADRMELFGFADAWETLEYLGKEARYPHDCERAHDQIMGPYRRNVGTEATMLINAASDIRRSAGTARTTISCGAVSNETQEELDSVRAQCRIDLDIGVHTRRPPVVNATRCPCDDCRSRAASEADTVETCADQICAYIDEHPKMIDAFRMSTAASHAPQLSAYMRRYYKEKG